MTLPDEPPFWDEDPDEDTDDDGCGTCGYDHCQCDTIYDNYRDSLLERD